MPICPNCGHDWVGPVPPEPGLGTWVRDRFGAAMYHHIDSDGNNGWAPGPSYMALANWKAMWEARGPLIECGPWGSDREEANN